MPNATSTAQERATIGSFSPASGIIPNVPEPFGKQYKNFSVVYGKRIDDGAMVFHFYPAAKDDGWDRRFRMDARLERSINNHFDVAKVTCGFASEPNSFYVIVGGLGLSLDPWTLCDRFLESVELPLGAVA